MAGLVLQESVVHPDHVDPNDLKETEVLKDTTGLPGLKAIRAFKDPRAILENPSLPLLLCHLRSPWW